MNRKSRKGLEEYIAVPIGLLFIIVLAFGLKFAGSWTLIQSHILVEQKFSFESKFSNLIGQSNQLLSVKDFDGLDDKLMLTKNAIDKLSYWLAFYVHGTQSDSDIKFQVINPESEGISYKELKEVLTKQLNDTAKLTLPAEIFYSMLFEEINVKNSPPGNELESFGRVILPIPIPGGKIEYFKFGREETNYNLILTQEGE